MSARNQTGAAAADRPRLFWVGLYLLNRCFGGDEEGGWWFDEGTLVADPGVYKQLAGAPAAFFDSDTADRHADELRARLPLLNDGRRHLHSVLSTGVYEILVIEADVLPQTYPEMRPDYE